MTFLIKNKLTKILKAIIFTIVAVYFLNYLIKLYYQNRSSEWSINQKKIDKDLKDNSKNFNIDSLASLLKKDSMFNVSDVYLTTDSIMFICMTPKINTTEKEYFDFCNNYNLNYALNTALIRLVKPFPSDSAKSITFVPDNLFVTARYGSRYYFDLIKLKEESKK